MVLVTFPEASEVLPSTKIPPPLVLTPPFTVIPEVIVPPLLSLTVVSLLSLPWATEPATEPYATPRFVRAVDLFARLLRLSALVSTSLVLAFSFRLVVILFHAG